MIGGLLIVGVPLPFHVGGHLQEAARQIGLEASVLDSASAYGTGLLQRAAWRLLDRMPIRKRKFEQAVLETCQRDRPRWVLTTGIAPLSYSALRTIEQLGIRRLNYLTDDPWNPGHRAEWFLKALPAYDTVFTPRHANVGDLTALGCTCVKYLPFAYDVAQHFPEHAVAPERLADLACDVLFVGCGDSDRYALVAPVIQSGLQVSLYGGYWHKHPITRQADRGHADAATLRQAAAAAKVSLCLVRRANRDGHVMRTYEMAACRSCMLVEDTVEHRAILGPDGECVVYFDSIPCMIQQARRLLADGQERDRLAQAAYRRIVVEGRNTYTDRLRTMLDHERPA